MQESLLNISYFTCNARVGINQLSMCYLPQCSVLYEERDQEKVILSLFWHVHFSFAFTALIFFPFCLSHQKLDGCNKMTCTGCMQYFCWICMGSLSRANPYKHFTDPASLCFNRYVHTQFPRLSSSFWPLICRPQIQCLTQCFAYQRILLHTSHIYEFLYYFLQNEVYDENTLPGNFLFLSSTFYSENFQIEKLKG